MIFEWIDIDTAYAIVLGATAFCLALAGIAWVVSKVKKWNDNRKLFNSYLELHGSKNDSNKNKS